MRNREIALKESISDKVKDRDNQAKIILEIIELAKKLKHCTCEVAKEIRYPQYINEKNVESIRNKLDYDYWYRTLEEYQVEKLLTTTDKEKLYEKLEADTPAFNYENVMNTIGQFLNSKDATATVMIKKIYEEVTNIVFKLGNNYHSKSQKRLQVGIPKSFRMSMFYGGIPGYISSNNSRFHILDDLERACYLVDSKLQPDRQCSFSALTTDVLRANDTDIVEGPYFTMKMFKNGNIKIDFKNLDILKRLNYWGLKGNRLK